MLLRAFASVSRPLCRFLLRTIRIRDSWDRIPCEVPLRMYGKGARRDFKWYFEGKSCVSVASIEEIKQWLLGCGYVRDPELFIESDFWQHPCTFEHMRKGDCEDYALWAWRKLVELGYDAEFVAGRLVLPGKDTVGHTWVLFREDEGTFLFDTVIQDADRMIRPVLEVRFSYLPEVSIDRDFKRYAYGAYLSHRRRPFRKFRSLQAQEEISYELSKPTFQLESSP